MKKWILTFAGIIGGILVVLLVCLGLAQQAVVHQPIGKTSASMEDLPTDNPWVMVRMDERMFTLFAAFNAAGYDQENFGESYHPVRQLVRERLAGKSFSGLERLRAELKFVHTSNFVTWILHYSQPPEFVRAEPDWSGPGMPAFLFYGLDRSLRSFYEEMDIATLWEEVRPQYEEESARYQQAAGEAVQAAVEYTRMKDVPLKQVVVIPNLLSAHWSGNGPTVGGIAYVVVGPTGDQPDVGLIQHEALHSIVGPLVETNLGVIAEENGAALYANLRKRVPPSYGSWESIVEEQVVRAIGCRLAGPDCEGYLLQNDEEEGFLLERALVNVLADFELTDGSLAEFMPEMLGTINRLELP